jgi:hypothetical protein
MSRDHGRHVAVFDLDGTLANVEAFTGLAEAKDWDGFYQRVVTSAKPYPEMIDLLMAWHMMSMRNSVIICTGRSEQWRDQTIHWLQKHRVYYDRLLMRPAGDHRYSRDLKQDILFKAISKDRIAFIVEDRDKLVAMWRSIGLPCLQCRVGAY